MGLNSTKYDGGRNGVAAFGQRNAGARTVTNGASDLKFQQIAPNERKVRLQKKQVPVVN